MLLHDKTMALIISIISGMALIALRCANLGSVAGTVTQSGNGFVCGVVVDSETLVSGARVLLIPAQYDPNFDTPLPDSLIDTTGPSGAFSIAASKLHVYNVEVEHISGKNALLCGVGFSTGDTQSTGLLRLALPGSIKVIISDTAKTSAAYVYIPGTTFFSTLHGDTAFLTSVPAGSIPELTYNSAAAGSKGRVIKQDVVVTSGMTTTIADYSFWTHSKPLYLNTTISGANIAGNVTDFPVLIRLTSNNFDFSQAGANGEDVRFTKTDATPLAYEVDRWDGGARKAEIWVKLDTIYGNDSMQSITMYWGNPDAHDNSNGPAVFDTANGFQGVWHLNETSGTLARDASHNGFMGTYKGGLPKNVTGPTGICQNITRPDTDYIDMGNVLNPGMKNFALGVWLKRAALSTQQALIAKTNGNAPSTAYGYLLNIDDNNIPHLYMASGGTSWGGDSAFDVKANLAISDSTTWHYACAVIDRSNNALCKMYIDGIDRTGVKAGNVAGVSALVNALTLHIGTESDDNCSYSGAIGEMTVAFTARSADWVKLCYMNQKEQDALVKW